MHGTGVLLQSGASADVFLHALVYPSLEVGTLLQLILVLKAIDPTLQLFRDELSAANVHFMAKKMFHVAYVFQDLLQVTFVYSLSASSSCSFNTSCQMQPSQLLLATPS